MTLPLSLKIPLQSFFTSGPQEARKAVSVTAWAAGGLADGRPELCVFSDGGATPGAGRAAAKRDIHDGDNWL
jgi:hypothetical protein